MLFKWTISKNTVDWSLVTTSGDSRPLGLALSANSLSLYDFGHDSSCYLLSSMNPSSGSTQAVYSVCKALDKRRANVMAYKNVTSTIDVILIGYPTTLS
jgi:hypothetical protein